MGSADWTEGLAEDARVALFGGSFDPPHRGHLAVAHAAGNAFRLDRVVLMPTGLQPLKLDGAAAGFADRLAMTRLLLGEDSRLSVSDLDAPRSDGSPNYTVDLLEEMHRQLPAARMYAIAGVDSFLELPRWRAADRLLELAEWVVVSRPGFSLAVLDRLALPERLRNRVHVLRDVHVPVSATELRARLARGEDCSDALPAPVQSYVREHRLYGFGRSEQGTRNANE